MTSESDIAWREDARIFFWSMQSINILTAVAFLVGGGYRYSFLMDIGYQQKKYSRLFSIKLFLYWALALVDTIVVIYTFIHAFTDEADQAQGDVHVSLSMQGHDLFVTVLVVESVNFVVYVFAAILLHYEYMRQVTEAWYAHKFFIWSNLTLRIVHLIFFFPILSVLPSALEVTRISILGFIMGVTIMSSRKTVRNRSMKNSDFRSSNFITREGRFTIAKRPSEEINWNSKEEGTVE